MKKIGFLLLGVFLLVMLAGGLSCQSKPVIPDTSTPEGTIELFLQAQTELDPEKLSRCYVEEDREKVKTDAEGGFSQIYSFTVEKVKIQVLARTDTTAKVKLTCDQTISPAWSKGEYHDVYKNRVSEFNLVKQGGEWLIIASSANPAPTKTSTTQSQLISPPFLDADGDGYSDWFEENIAHSNLLVPNNRYFIIYHCMLDPNWEKDVTGPPEEYVDKQAERLIEEWRILPENIIKLVEENASAFTLRDAIQKVSQESTENDLFFLSITAHGSTLGYSEGYGAPNNTGGSIDYQELNQWLDKIQAKALIITVVGCGNEEYIPLIREGSSPRIVLDSSRFMVLFDEFDKAYFFIADAIYGNGDGYLALAEAVRWMEKSGGSAQSYNTESPQGIASQIYLNDYTLSEEEYSKFERLKVELEGMEVLTDSWLMECENQSRLKSMLKHMLWEDNPNIEQIIEEGLKEQEVLPPPPIEK